MRWFFAPPEAWGERDVALPADESHHALTVLRIAPPDVITVIDGRGRVARCAVNSIGEGRLTAEILESDRRRPLKPQIAVYQGVTKGAKIDEVVDRVAELGAAELWVYDSTRAVARWKEDKLARLTDRWTSIATTAAKRSRNPYALIVGGGLSWTGLVRRIAKEPLAIVLWEEASLPLRTALVGESDRLAIVIGPEGGLAREEAEQLADAGAQLVSLGPHILATENAAAATVAALLYHYGLIG